MKTLDFLVQFFLYALNLKHFLSFAKADFTCEHFKEINRCRGYRQWEFAY